MSVLESYEITIDGCVRKKAQVEAAAAKTLQTLKTDFGCRAGPADVTVDAGKRAVSIVFRSDAGVPRLRSAFAAAFKAYNVVVGRPGDAAQPGAREFELNDLYPIEEHNSCSLAGAVAAPVRSKRLHNMDGRR